MLFVLFCVWNKIDSIFMRMKTSKKKKVVCLTFCAFCVFYAFYAFNAHKKHLRGGAAQSRFELLCFLCFLCVWNLLVKKKLKRFKIPLIPSFTILLMRNPLNLPMENYLFTYFYLWSSVKIFPFYENLLNLSFLWERFKSFPFMRIF